MRKKTVKERAEPDVALARLLKEAEAVGRACTQMGIELSMEGAPGGVVTVLAKYGRRRFRYALEVSADWDNAHYPLTPALEFTCVINGARLAPRSPMAAQLRRFLGEPYATAWLSDYALAEV